MVGVSWAKVNRGVIGAAIGIVGVVVGIALVPQVAVVLSVRLALRLAYCASE
ncbi:MAG TPA: hypothetical protein VM912_19615 [Terriglobales bacterium]|nr:hypothetical protein [Terriglobales bacterium]